MKHILAQKTYKIGIQNLVWDSVENKYFVQIRNRTYSSEVEITREKAKIWYSKLRENDTRFTGSFY